MLQVKTEEKLQFIDWVWLIYNIIIFSFNVAFDNVQMISTILLFLISFICLCFKGNTIQFHIFRWEDCSVWYGIFFLFVLFSYFWSSSLGRSQINMLTTLIQIFVFILCLDWYVKSKREVDILLNWFCISSVCFAFVILLTTNPSDYNSLEFGSFTGQHRNASGYILMFACFANLFNGWKRRERIYYFFSIVCIIVSLLSGSRKIIFGYLIAIVLWVYFQDNVKKVIKYSLLIIVVLSILIPVLYQIPYVRDTFGERLLAILDNSIEDGSVLARERAQTLARVLFKQSPIWGNGWNAVSANYATYWDRKMTIYAHNNYLELAADFGIIGVGLFYVRLFRNLFRCYLRAKVNSEYKFLFIGMSVILVLDYGQVTFSYLFLIWIFVFYMKYLQVLPDNGQINLEILLKRKK